MRELLRRVWSALHHHRLADELAEEMAFHRAKIQQELEARGAGRSDARLAARRAIGSTALAADRSRDVWLPRWLEGVGQDVRLAVRMLLTHRLVSAVAVVSLALGIGANTAMFSLADSLLLRPLPVRDASRLVLITDGTAPGIRTYSYAVWDQLRQRTQFFDGVAAWSLRRFDVATGGETQFVNGLWASGSFFDTLGVRAALGRTFSDADDRRAASLHGPVAVVTYSFWQQRLGAAADVIGHTIVLDRLPFTIVGVTPPSFFGPVVGRSLDVIVPLENEPLLRGRESKLDGRGLMWLTLMARLRPGLSAAAATAGLRGVQSQIREATLPDSSEGPPHAFDQYLSAALTLIPAATGDSPLRRRFEQPLQAMMVVVGLVLLIACANIANLLLARAAARQHEVSLRRALGASRSRLVRQLLTESAVLAAIGTACGLPIAFAGSRLLVRQLSTERNLVFLDLSIDWRVLAFTVGVTVVTAFLFGVVPAIRGSRVAPIQALKAHGRSTHADGRIELASILIVAQVALSVLLVVAAGLFVRTFSALATRPLGFERDHVLLVTISAPPALLEPARRVAVYERAREAVRALPGVTDAALSLTTPVSGDAFTPRIDVSGAVRLADGERVSFGNVISPGWFHTFDTPLISGRDLTSRDRQGTIPVVIVNQAFARKFLNGASPLGHTITLALNGPAPDPPIEIVGVVADAVYRSLRDPVPATMYLPLAQQADTKAFVDVLASVSLSVRSAPDDPALLTKSVAAAIGAVSPNLALTFRPLADQVDASLSQERLIAMVSGCLGALALFLAALGLYGITSYAVARRRMEIAIRLALGAAPMRILRLVFQRVSLLVGLGVFIGVGLSWWASTLVATLLYGLEPRDMTTLLNAALVLTIVGALAGWLPAWRASRIDPARVLRDD